VFLRYGIYRNYLQSRGRTARLRRQPDRTGLWAPQAPHERYEAALPGSRVC
jgi:hypothetical protein